MMTTVQIAERLMFYYQGAPTVGDLPLSEKMQLINAVNFGLGEFLSKLPESRLNGTESWLLRAPIVQTINIVNGAKGFSYLSGSPYPIGGYLTESESIGHTVVISGDSKPNRLMRNGSLLHPYTGETGNVSMTIYGDAANMGETDQRLLSTVDLIDGSGKRKRLIPSENSFSTPLPIDVYPRNVIELDEPVRYHTESHLGSEFTNTPLWHIRVWPIPVAQYIITASVLRFPASLTIEDFTTPRNLPLTVQEEPLLLALIAPGLRLSSKLARHIVKSDLQIEADRAKLRLTEMNKPLDGNPGRIMTEEGY